MHTSVQAATQKTWDKLGVELALATSLARLRCKVHGVHGAVQTRTISLIAVHAKIDENHGRDLTHRFSIRKTGTYKAHVQSGDQCPASTHLGGLSSKVRWTGSPWRSKSGGAGLPLDNFYPLMHDFPSKGRILFLASPPLLCRHSPRSYREELGDLYGYVFNRYATKSFPVVTIWSISMSSPMTIPKGWAFL